MTHLWEQAIKLARALDNANRVGNNDYARLHHQALILKLKEIINKLEEQKQ